MGPSIQNSHMSMISGYWAPPAPFLSSQCLTALVLSPRVTMPPGSHLSGKWDPENSTLTMLQETLAPPSFFPPSPQSSLPNCLLQGHLFQSVVNIPLIPPPHPFFHPLRDKSQGPTSSSLPTFFSSPSYSPSLPSHVTTHLLAPFYTLT